MFEMSAGMILLWAPLLMSLTEMDECWMTYVHLWKRVHLFLLFAEILMLVVMIPGCLMTKCPEVLVKWLKLR